MDRHNQSFFGQKTAILFDSGFSSDAYSYFRFIKKTDAGWEKPSENGGKSIKLSIMEMICIADVLAGENDSWSTVHRFNTDTTSLSFVCEDRAKKVFKFSVSGNNGNGSYVKQIYYPESKFLHSLLDHIIQEKIENATGNKPQNVEEEQNIGNVSAGNENYGQDRPTNDVTFATKAPTQTRQMPVKNNSYNQINPNTVKNTNAGQYSNENRDVTRTSAKPNNLINNINSFSNDIQKPQEEQETTDFIASAKVVTNKAVLLELEPGNEFWVPKSAIVKGDFDTIGLPVPYSVKSWVMKNRAVNV